MNTKADIEIVTGFIGAGKTTFINSLIKNTYLNIENLLIIQYEQGNQKILEVITNDNNINLEVIPGGSPLDSFHLENIIKKYKPHRVIIEYNGTKNLSDLLDVLYSKSIKKIAKVTSTFFITDCLTYDMFLNNMPTLITPNLYHSNLVIFNNSNKIPEKNLSTITKEIRSINKDSFFLNIDDISKLDTLLDETGFMDRGFFKATRILTKNFISKLTLRR